MTATAPLRVLVIGAGYRVQNNYLPVLRALQDRFKVAGVHARTATRMLPVAERWGIPAVASLDDSVLAAVDVVAISVPTDQNAIVLRALLPHAARLSLVVDTPVAASLRQVAAVVPLLAKFRRVAVTEDHMNFPAYALLRRAVAQGLIGKPTAIALNNTGYLYHGLAVIRSFVGFQPVSRSWQRSVGTMTNLTAYKFHGGFEGCVLNPYYLNQPDGGGLTLEGTEGIITQFPADLMFATPSRPVYLLRACHTKGLLSGYAIEAGTKSMEISSPELAPMYDMPFDDKSEHNMRRGCGMATIFRSLLEPEADPETRLNAAYGADNALYDSVVSRLAERGLLPIDPLTWIGLDVMNVVRMLSRVRP